MKQLLIKWAWKILNKYQYPIEIDAKSIFMWNGIKFKVVFINLDPTIDTIPILTIKASEYDFEK